VTLEDAELLLDVLGQSLELPLFDLIFAALELEARRGVEMFSGVDAEAHGRLGAQLLAEPLIRSCAVAT